MGRTFSAVPYTYLKRGVYYFVIIIFSLAFFLMTGCDIDLQSGKKIPAYDQFLNCVKKSEPVLSPEEAKIACIRRYGDFRDATNSEDSYFFSDLLGARAFISPDLIRKNTIDVELTNLSSQFVILQSISIWVNDAGMDYSIFRSCRENVIKPTVQKPTKVRCDIKLEDTSRYLTAEDFWKAFEDAGSDSSHLKWRIESAYTLNFQGN